METCGFLWGPTHHHSLKWDDSNTLVPFGNMKNQTICMSLLEKWKFFEPFLDYWEGIPTHLEVSVLKRTC